MGPACREPFFVPPHNWETERRIADRKPTPGFSHAGATCAPPFSPTTTLAPAFGTFFPGTAFSAHGYVVGFVGTSIWDHSGSVF